MSATLLFIISIITIALGAAFAIYHGLKTL